MVTCPGSPINIPPEKRIFIITVNWNSYQDVSFCLDSLRKLNYKNVTCIVVDNGSTDGSLDLIRERYQESVILKHERNLGLCAANNTGLQYALTQQADFCLILNNDTHLDAEILNEFLDAAQKHPDAGVFGAKIYYYSDPQRIWWAMPVWDEQRAGFNNLGSDQIDNGQEYSQIAPIDYANGCAMFVRMEVVKKIGLMDERFFIYYEDVDFSTRAKKAGYKILFVPKAKLWHKVAQSSGGKGSPVELYFKARNQLLWASKNGSTRKPYYLVRKLCKFFQLLSKYIHSDQRILIQVQIRGILDFARGRYGDCPQYIRNKALIIR